VTLSDSRVDIFTKHSLAGEIVLVVAPARSGFAINGGQWKVTANDGELMKQMKGLYLFRGSGTAAIESLREQELTLTSGSFDGALPRPLEGVLKKNIGLFLRTNPSATFDIPSVDPALAYTISQPFGVPLRDATGEILAIRAGGRFPRQAANISRALGRTTADYLSCSECEYECYDYSSGDYCGIDPWCDNNCYDYCYTAACNSGSLGWIAGVVVGVVVIGVVIGVVICCCCPCCKRAAVAQEAAVVAPAGQVLAYQQPVVYGQQAYAQGYAPQMVYGQQNDPQAGYAQAYGQPMVYGQDVAYEQPQQVVYV
jgi:hypothetical protein